MNKILVFIGSMIVLNILFTLIPNAIPSVSRNMLFSYQLWFNSIVIFYLVLPSTVGNFKLLFGK
jgi:hypothetical protein